MIKRILLFSSVLCFSTLCCASDITPSNFDDDDWWNINQDPRIHQTDQGDYRPKSLHFVATLTTGADLLKNTQSQTVALIPPFENYYRSSGDRNIVADVGLFVGLEKPLSSNFSAQIGIAGYWDTSFSEQGTTSQFNQMLFNNLDYTYDIRHSRLMFSGKLLSSMPNSSAHPYLSLEIGGALNQASNYYETSFTPGVFPMTPYTNKRQSSFSYGVGAGIDYNFTKHIRLGAGYQFANLGSVTLGPSPVALTTDSLEISHLYANQLRVQLTYIL